MKIVEIIPRLYPVGGAETFLVSLSLSLHSKLDDDVEVICLYDDENANFLSKKLLENGVKVHCIGKHPGIDLKCARRLHKKIKEIKPDIIHIHLESINTTMIARLWNIAPCFYTFHNTMNEITRGKPNSIKNVVFRSFFKKHRVFPVAISSAVQKSIENFFGIKNSVVILNGINIDNFNYSIDYFKRRNDFIFIGRFTEIKHPLSIIQAFERVQKKSNDSILTMLGIGPLLDSCKEYVSNHKLKNVEILGFQENPASFLENSRFLLLSSSVEGNPIVVNEAIASGTYVISTAVGGLPDIVNDETGTLFKFSEETLIDDLSRVMLKCIDEEKEIFDKINSSILKNRKRVSIDEKAEQYHLLFQKSLGKEK